MLNSNSGFKVCTGSELRPLAVVICATGFLYAVCHSTPLQF